jgi:hypothetical protein
MWLVSSGLEYCSYRFMLNNKELVFIELEYKHLKSGFKAYYVGYYIGKCGNYFNLSGENLSSLLFKSIIGLKYSGWDIDGFPIDIK